MRCLTCDNGDAQRCSCIPQSFGRQRLPAASSAEQNIQHQQPIQTLRHAYSDSPQSPCHILAISIYIAIAPKAEEHQRPTIKTFIETLAANHNRRVPNPRSQMHHILGGTRPDPPADEWSFTLRPVELLPSPTTSSPRKLLTFWQILALPAQIN
jgi:hypothetical protein